MEKNPRTRPEMLTVAAARNYPGSEILVTFPDRWQLVHRFRRGNTPLYVAGFPASYERTRPDQFFGLSPEINRSLDTYRQYRLFEPRPTYQFDMAWDSRTGQGQIVGGRGLQVHLQPLGQAQMWKGETNGVIWECFSHETRRGGTNWQEELAIFWQAVERDMEVKRIFTEPHEPTFEEGYTDFLSRLGYAPDSDFERWWSKRG